MRVEDYNGLLDLATPNGDSQCLPPVLRAPHLLCDEIVPIGDYSSTLPKTHYAAAPFDEAGPVKHKSVKYYSNDRWEQGPDKQKSWIPSNDGEGHRVVLANAPAMTKQLRNLGKKSFLPSVTNSGARQIKWTKQDAINFFESRSCSDLTSAYSESFVICAGNQRGRPCEDFILARMLVKWLGSRGITGDFVFIVDDLVTVNDLHSFVVDPDDERSRAYFGTEQEDLRFNYAGGEVDPKTQLRRLDVYNRDINRTMICEYLYISGQTSVTICVSGPKSFTEWWIAAGAWVLEIVAALFLVAAIVCIWIPGIDAVLIGGWAIITAAHAVVCAILVSTWVVGLTAATYLLYQTFDDREKFTVRFARPTARMISDYLRNADDVAANIAAGVYRLDPIDYPFETVESYSRRRVLPIPDECKRDVAAKLFQVSDNEFEFYWGSLVRDDYGRIVSSFDLFEGCHYRGDLTKMGKTGDLHYAFCCTDAAAEIIPYVLFADTESRVSLLAAILDEIAKVGVAVAGLDIVDGTGAPVFEGLDKEQKRKFMYSLRRLPLFLKLAAEIEFEITGDVDEAYAPTVVPIVPSGVNQKVQAIVANKVTDAIQKDPTAHHIKLLWDQEIFCDLFGDGRPLVEINLDRYDTRFFRQYFESGYTADMRSNLARIGEAYTDGHGVYDWAYCVDILTALAYEFALRMKTAKSSLLAAGGYPPGVDVNVAPKWYTVGVIGAILAALGLVTKQSTESDK